MTETRELQTINLGLKSYGEALEFQQEFHRKVLDDLEEDVLILCEHPHVYTFGKSANHNNLLVQKSFLEKINATVFETDRGGDVTYHGPGQLVGYPIIKLADRGLGVRSYVELLEQSIIDALLEYEIHAFRIPGLTGLWVEGKFSNLKIGAIGIRVSRGVTMHGFALNIHTDLSYFNHIIPCGIQDKGVTSVKEQGVDCSISEFSVKFESCFRERLNNQ